MLSSECGKAEQRPLIFDPDKWMDSLSYGLPHDVARRASIINAEIDILNGETWDQNIETNLRLVKEETHLDNVFGSWAGKRILMCGAGRTLRNNKEHVLNAHKRGVKIVCVDRAFPLLKAWGITPHAVVTMDHQIDVKNYLDKIDSNDTFVVNLFQHPEVVNIIHKKVGKVYFYLLACATSSAVSMFYNKYDHRLFSMRSAGSVGFIATDYALWMAGEKPKWIATVGNELCWFSLKDVEPYYGENLDFKLRWLYSPKYKKHIYTIDPFYTTAQSFLFFTMFHKHTRFVDCSFGMLENFERKSLANLLAEGVN